jgi:hypothetical protein
MSFKSHGHCGEYNDETISYYKQGLLRKDTWTGNKF